MSGLPVFSQMARHQLHPIMRRLWAVLTLIENASYIVAGQHPPRVRVETGMTLQSGADMAVPAHTPVNILLLDDTPAKLLTYEVILSELKENLIKTNSAEEAFAVLLKHDVALVVADVAMPDIDGFEFARTMRAHPRFVGIPIVFVSAIAHSDHDRMHGYRSGAVDYVTVPILPEMLRAKVKTFLDLYRRQRELEALKVDLETRVAERTARLAESEERYRTLVDNASDIVATMDLKGNFTSVNPAVEKVLGYAPRELIGRNASISVPAGEMRKQESMLQRKLEGEISTQYETQAFARDGRRIYLEVSSKLIFDRAGKPVGIHSIARDITDRKEAEERQNVLIHELQHRTKNLLAVMQSIVTNTIAHSRDLAGAQDAILGRLHALARAQEFITEGTNAGVGLRELVKAELSAFGTRLQVVGLPIVLGGSFAQQFALVIHELATNAAKYGALSTPNGRVVIAWEIVEKTEGAVLSFHWNEIDGPPVVAPTEQGFGTRLLSVAGMPRVVYRKTGLEFAIDVPLSLVIGAGKPAS
jgi:PAS domain S-box-containing protein